MSATVFSIANQKGGVGKTTTAINLSYALADRGVRTVLVEPDMLDITARPDPDARVVARLETGVIARLSECGPSWCALSAGGHDGWAPKAALWGVGPGEIVE